MTRALCFQIWRCRGLVRWHWWVGCREDNLGVRTISAQTTWVRDTFKKDKMDEMNLKDLKGSSFQLPIMMCTFLMTVVAQSQIHSKANPYTMVSNVFMPLLSNVHLHGNLCQTLSLWFLPAVRFGWRLMSPTRLWSRRWSANAPNSVWDISAHTKTSPTGWSWDSALQLVVFITAVLTHSWELLCNT